MVKLFNNLVATFLCIGAIFLFGFALAQFGLVSWDFVDPAPMAYWPAVGYFSIVCFIGFILKLVVLSWQHIKFPSYGYPIYIWQIELLMYLLCVFLLPLTGDISA